MIADAAISGATGLLLAGGAGFLAGWLGVPEGLMRYAGLALVPFAAVVLYLANSPEPPRAGVRTIIALNLLWAAASILLLVSGAIEPTSLGMAFVIFQAVVVVGFADVQYLALRKV